MSCQTGIPAADGNNKTMGTIVFFVHATEGDVYYNFTVIIIKTECF